MSILVVCPGCRKSFKVDDKFAGRSGNCPQCKHPIKVPSLKEQVKVHGGEDFSRGGKTQSGQLALKPVSRKELKVGPVAVASVVGASLAVLLLTFLLRTALQKSLIVCGLGLLVISPPLVLAAYAFLRNDELEPFRGKALYIRTAICSAVYILLWGAFTLIGNYGYLTEEPFTWLIVAPPLIIAGAIAAFACFELDFASASLHYAFYALITLLLRFAAGVPWPWQQGG